MVSVVRSRLLSGLIGHFVGVNLARRDVRANGLLVLRLHKAFSIG